MEISEKKFGMLSNGKRVHLYTLRAGDIKLTLTDYGACWTSLIVPSHKGDDDILLGYSTLDGYTKNDVFFGVTVGRFANRIKNATFDLNGKTYNLEANDGGNSLHSGNKGFHNCLWKAETYKENEGVYVRFELNSPDGDGGFPGSLKAVVNYGLTKSNEIICDYHAKTDEPCPVNLTNHAYFNLKGEGRGDILSHEALLFSSSYVEVDDNNIPTGKLIAVDGTDFDFRKRRKIRKDDASKKPFNGYDHCFVVDGELGKLRPCAEVHAPFSGRSIKVYTTQPGVQFYTGNFLNGIAGKQGSRYAKHHGFCLETQHFPDTPNQPGFPPCTIVPGKDYNEKTVFSFMF